jgi:hypothetical protein
VTVGPFRAGLAVVRRLNDSMARLAMFEPERFRELRESQPLSSGEFELALGPYETVCLDIEEL